MIVSKQIMGTARGPVLAAVVAYRERPLSAADLLKTNS